MSLTQKINKALIAGTLVLSMYSCTPQKPIHKDCYGLHIKENPSNIMVEFYKEGWMQFREPVDGTICIQITKDSIRYNQNEFTRAYKLELKPNSSGR